VATTEEVTMWKLVAAGVTAVVAAKTNDTERSFAKAITLRAN
jgi:hypothetical protein